MRRSSRTPTPPVRRTAGGCRVQSSASASTWRSRSSTAVVPARSASAGVRSVTVDRAAASASAAPSGAPPRGCPHAPARPRAATRPTGRRSGPAARGRSAASAAALRDRRGLAGRRGPGRPAARPPAVRARPARRRRRRRSARRPGPDRRGRSRSPRPSGAGSPAAVRASAGRAPARDRRWCAARRRPGAEAGRIGADRLEDRRAPDAGRRSSPQIRASSASSSTAAARRRPRSPSSSSAVLERRLGAVALSTSASSTRSCHASRESTARCTEVRTAIRLASVVMSAGAGRPRSGRRRSSAISSSSVRARSHCASVRGADGAGRATSRSVAGQRGAVGRAGVPVAEPFDRQRELDVVAERRQRAGHVGGELGDVRSMSDSRPSTRRRDRALRSRPAFDRADRCRTSPTVAARRAFDAARSTRPWRAPSVGVSPASNPSAIVALPANCCTKRVPGQYP